MHKHLLRLSGFRLDLQLLERNIMKKFLCIVVIAVFMLCMGYSVAFAADKLDTEDVKEIKIASIAASYRDAPLHGENVKDIEKGEKIYIIDYIDVDIRVCGFVSTLTYYLCNTDEGLLYLYEGFTRYPEELYKDSTNSNLSNTINNIEGMTYVGNFKCTTYCPCSICNEGYTGTATGAKLTPWYTIAVDPNYIPLGSTVYIEGLGTFKAQDVGGAIKGHKIDICVDSHSTAQTQTWYDMPVYIVN